MWFLLLSFRLTLLAAESGINYSIVIVKGNSYGAFGIRTSYTSSISIENF